MSRSKMYLHIAVLIVASAFPVVERVLHADDPASQDGHLTRKERSREVAGMVVLHNNFNPSIMKAILAKKIRTQNQTKGVSASGITKLVSFKNNSHNDRLVDISADDNFDDAPFDPYLEDEVLTGCQRVFGFKYTGIVSVHSCPKNFKKLEIRELCTSRTTNENHRNGYDLEVLPVQSEDGIVYRNRYCAICNNASKPKHWNINFLCEAPTSLLFQTDFSSVKVLEEYQNTSTCDVQISPPYDKPIEECQIRAKRRSSTKWRHGKPDIDVYPISFSLLMNFGFDGKTHVMFSTNDEITESKRQSRCPENEIFDPDRNKCRRVSCSSGYSLMEDETCVKDGSAIIYNDTDIQNIKDVDSLTNNNRVALVALEVNVTYDDLGFVLYAIEFKPIIIKKLADLLNINSERIQNFSIQFLNQSDFSGQNIRVETMPKDEFEKQIQNVDVEDFNFDINEVFLDSPSTSDQLNETASEPTISDQLNETASEPTISDQLNETVSEATISDQLNETVSEAMFSGQLNETTSKPTFSGQLNETTSDPTISTNDLSITDLHSRSTTTATVTEIVHKDHVILNPQILQLSFILLPSHVDNSKESVADIISKMNALKEKNSFKFDMNGTTFNIVHVDEKDPERKNTFCKFGVMDMYFNNGFEIVKTKANNKPPVTRVYIPSSNSLYEPGEYDLTLLVEGNIGLNSNLTGVAGYVFVCINPRIVNRNCAQIKISPEEYKLFENKSILFNDEWYNMTQYSVLDELRGDLEICVPDEYYTNEGLRRRHHRFIQSCHDGFRDFTQAEGYITAIIGRLSVIALCSVLVTYWLFKSLRNLPGINTMNLTLALLIGETMFIEGESSAIPWVCSLVAISVHYFFLASFFWMNVMSYDVYKTFANKCILTRIRGTNKFLPRYALYAWGSPAIIVAVCVFIEYGNVFGSFKIGYGQDMDTVTGSDNVTEVYNNNTNETLISGVNHNSGCWITRPVAALIAFGLPIMLIFVINTVFFIRTIICIQATAKLAHHKTRRTFSHMTGKSDVMLYVRMSTVMGFTWIFGLASSIVSSILTKPDKTVCMTLRILSILFTVFNCGQGLFIFFAFIFKRRVFYLYKGLFKRVKTSIEKRKFKKLYSSSSNTISTVTSQM